MANAILNKSKHYKGEAIKGSFIITVDTEEPAIPAIDVLNAGLQLIIKKSYEDSDANAIADLSVGSGITVTQNTSTLYSCTYEIPGSVTQDLVSSDSRNSVVELVYEINITLNGETNSDVLEIGTLRIETKRVKSTFT